MSDDKIDTKEHPVIALEGPVTPPAVRLPEPALINQLSSAAQRTWERPTTSGASPKRRLPLPRVLAIANQKGGVGKTTTAVNLGASLAELGYRMLVIDLDPQGNATTGLGVNARNLDSSIYDVILHDLPIEDCIEPTNLRNLFLVPATIDLAGAEIELVPVFSRELRLKRAIATVLDDFDFVLIDCPPSLGTAHRQCPRRCTRSCRPHPVRVLRPGRPGAAAEQHRAG